MLLVRGIDGLLSNSYRRRHILVEVEKIYRLRDIISHMSNLKEEYYLEFLNTKSLDAGIIKLGEEQLDNQSTHSLDEIYYVIEGEGLISINGKNHQISNGSLVFVPANTKHKFHGNKGELIVLYIFAKG
jgi:mannose-6-phosphate isomerase-like protein (cupin superfamily)